MDVVQHELVLACGGWSVHHVLDLAHVNTHQMQGTLCAIFALKQIHGGMVAVAVGGHSQHVYAVYRSQDIAVFHPHLVRHAPARKGPHDELVVPDEPSNAQAE